MRFEEVLEKDGVLAYTTRGISMTPLIREGKDISVIKSVDSFNKNDIVLFRRPGVTGRGEYALHRIKSVDGDSFFIIGDHDPYGEKVLRENILGRLEALNRDDKELSGSELKKPGYLFYIEIRRVYFKFKRKIKKTLKALIR